VGYLALISAVRTGWASMDSVERTFVITAVISGAVFFAALTWFAFY
jgi:hypothetical protein